MKVCVVGTGRVGLPLALFLTECGFEVVGVDRDEHIRRKINEERRMPFHEPGFEEVVARGPVTIMETIMEAPGCDYYVVTVGTPLMPHIEADLSAVTSVIGDLCRILESGQTIILRSTLAPGTTQYIANLIELRTDFRVGEDVFLACCPERIVEGRAREEIATLPQIVGANDAASLEKATSLYRQTGVRTLPCDWKAAELVKLFNNASRYVYFAMSNYLAMQALEWDADPLHILHLANDGYPRPIAGVPGFTAGTCLRKDFGMLSEGYRGSDFLINAWRINESLPTYLVKAAVKRWGNLAGRKVAVLGYAFKMDTDDVRDSLVPKLARALAHHGPPWIRVTDPHVPEDGVEPLPGLSFHRDWRDALDGADLAFMATNHTFYAKEAKEIKAALNEGGIPCVDVWNVLGHGNVFVLPDTEPAYEGPTSEDRDPSHKLQAPPLSTVPGPGLG
jgi:UDP-N-acetyl-D-mannosaminuronic acid dehydrogenase